MKILSLGKMIWGLPLTPKQFLTDYPVFLVTGTSYKRHPDKGDQIPGLFVNSNGQLKPEGVEPSDINRFSFRLAGAAGRWKKYDTQPPEILKSGDQVNIYCHSLGIGPYANIEKPPKVASAVLYSPHERKFAVNFDDHVNTSEVRSVIQQYDYGTLQRRDRDAFEMKGYLTSTDRVKKIKPNKTPSAQPFSYGVPIGGQGVAFETREASISAGLGVPEVGGGVSWKIKSDKTPSAWSFSPIGGQDVTVETIEASISPGLGVLGVGGRLSFEKVTTWEQRHPMIKEGYKIATFTILFE